MRHVFYIFLEDTNKQNKKEPLFYNFFSNGFPNFSITVYAEII